MIDFIDKEAVLELNIDDVKNALYYFYPLRYTE